MSAVVARARAARRAVTRIALAPLLLRAGIFFSALVGLLLALPAEVLRGQLLVVVPVVALLPAVGPRRIWPTVVALLTVGGWVLAIDGYDRPVALWRLFAVAAALYLSHTLCALVAVLPYDAVVDPAVVLRWLLRAVAVLLGTAVLGVLLVELAGVGGAQGLEAVTVAGLVVAVLVTALLGWLLRRR
ncbi:hypothetical protein [Salinispora sp. H7-4]|uniref:hypothetical protein n=1 Tax=Salinispora sp. H7-4 TaxID=2748321 RepID=UPI0015D0EC3D|nr:hypothetical protein [Salinispora sp. H7-4]NYT94180.1 hypothetical protein [Salinispora sp. H7-4]